MNRIIQFFKSMNLYDQKYFEQIQNKTTIYNKSYEEIRDFVGCYLIYQNNEIIDFKLILPNIKSIEDELIYVHEYSHALFLEDKSEIFPNIMEAYFINLYVTDLELKKKILDNIKIQLKKEEDINHKIGVKVKLCNIQ